MIRVVLAAVAVAAAVPAHAVRVVDYPVDEAAVAAAAAERAMAAAPIPARGEIDFGLDIAAEVDHDVVSAGVACSAYAIRNPMTAVVRRVFAAADRDGIVAAATDPAAAVAVRLDHAATLNRCVLTGELVGKCVTRVTLSGTITRRGAAGEAVVPFRIAVDEASKSSGLCAGLTRGIAVAGRNAVVKLVAEASTAAP